MIQGASAYLGIVIASQESSNEKGRGVNGQHNEFRTFIIRGYRW